MREVLRKEGRAAETGVRQAIHLCRGHFKDYHYRSGRGLFGRTHGLYWWDMQVRGMRRPGQSRRDMKCRRRRSCSASRLWIAGEGTRRRGMWVGGKWGRRTGWCGYTRSGCARGPARRDRDGGASSRGAPRRSCNAGRIPAQPFLALAFALEAVVFAVVVTPWVDMVAQLAGTVPAASGTPVTPSWTFMVGAKETWSKRARM